MCIEGVNGNDTEIFTMEGPKAETVIKLKEKGNACVREGKYEEAIFHYSHALKLDPMNYSIYSNRSLAFLRMEQHYFSMTDALQTIKIAPEWAKHPIVMALLTISIALVGFAIAKEETKPGQAEADEEEGGGAPKDRTPRYTKAQARQRFKKGKS
ncbi:hypothetical protein FOCC_FOCC008559 [Frankliniella occidentalis]|nr:hypothetical protein FOCC_FOCC008559 [Frankliniella occidentalis]